MTSDRERIIQLEAKVSDLEAELEAWRSYDADELPDERTTMALLAIRMHLGRARRHVRIDPGVTRLLLYLMDRPGRIVPRDVLCAAVAKGESGDVKPRIVNVRAYGARRVLKQLFPLGGGIETVWGQGYSMSPDTVAALRSILEPKARAA